ncbi:MAG: apolipoprotein N-acyltransferase [Planctomycetota bacterium]|nr:apolipoprotein N-acyltransferase [Planctomycetota bacterium]
MSRRLERTALTIVSGVCWAIPFLFDAASPFVFVCLVPFLFLVVSRRYQGVVFSSYAVGVIYIALSVSWQSSIWLPLPLVCGLYFGLYVLLFGWALSRSLRHTRLPLSLLCPALFIGMEFLRLYVSLFRSTWLHLAYPLHEWTSLIQISRWTGHFGVTAIILLCNVAVTEVALAVYEGRRLLSRRLILSFATATISLGIALGYGGFRDTRADDQDGPTIAVVQPNLHISEIISHERWLVNLDLYIQMTRDRGGDGIDLWIWPEAAYPGYLESSPAVIAAMKRLTRDLSTPILFGALGTRREGNEDRPTNTGFFSTPDEFYAGRYDKRVLVPFGETLPIIEMIPSLRRRVSALIHKAIGFRPHIAPGEHADPATIRWGTRDVRFGALICYEVVMPDLARQSRSAGADFLVNISNEAWFPPKEQDQMIAMAKFRAVENGISLVRATTNGITCVISPRGEVIASLPRGRRQAEVMVQEVPLTSSGPTFYARWGDLFSVVVLLVVGGLWLREWKRTRGET